MKASITYMIVVSLVLTVGSFLLKGQDDTKIDSLIHLVNGKGASKDQVERSKYIDQLSQLYHDHRQFAKSDSLDQLITDVYKEQVLGRRAMRARINGDWQLSKSLYQELIDFLQSGDKAEDLGDAYGHMALMLTDSGDHPQAIEAYQTAFDLVRDPGRKAELLEKLSRLFRKQKNFEKAEEYAREALALLGEQEQYNIVRGRILMNLGYEMVRQKRFEEADSLMIAAMEAWKNADPLFQINGYMALFDSYKWSGRDAQAIALLPDFDRLGKQLSQPSDLVVYNLIKGEIFYLKNELSEAEKFVQKSIEYATATKQYTYIGNGYKAMMDIELKRNDHAKANIYKLRYYDMRDSLYRVETAKKAEELEAKFKRVQQDKKIALLDAENDLQKLRNKNQAILLSSATVGLGVLSFLLFRLFGQNKKITTQNELITKANAEKEVLLKEIHHRVKNNLQVISSLLGLQSLSIKDQAAKDAIQEGRSRVHSMSLIHQSLYKKDNLTGIEMEPYVQKLCKDLINTYQVGDTKITFHEEVQSGLMLDVETVVPLGLIINELVTNSLKYAFSDREKGLITVAMSEGDGQLKLTVADNGVGMDAASLESKQDSFGHSLIRAFKDKLDAEISMSGEDGVKVTLLIENYKRIHL